MATNEIYCPIRNAPCMGRYCEFYDVINKRCPHGAEAAREKMALLKSIENNIARITNMGTYRW